MSADDDEKVEGAKTKENGLSILATGGTWEFIGKEMVGIAVTSPATRVRERIQDRVQDAMILEKATTAQ